jgi:hypothetical protein
MWAAAQGILKVLLAKKMKYLFKTCHAKYGFNEEYCSLTLTTPFFCTVRPYIKLLKIKAAVVPEEIRQVS